MKKSSLVAAAGLFLLASCHSSYKTTGYQATDVQVTTGTTPVYIENSFKAQYPNANNVVWGYYDPIETGIPIDWQLTGYVPYANSRLVHFSQDNQSYQVMYDQNGMQVATAQVISDVNTLPSSLRDQLLALYPHYTISGLSRITLTNQGNKMAYEVDLKKMYYTTRVLIDDNGKIIDQRTMVSDKL